MAYWVLRLFSTGGNLLKPLQFSAYEQFLPIIQSPVNCLVLNASFVNLPKTITSLFKSEKFMIWSTVKNNILSTKWLCFFWNFQKTKYFGSQNSNNHLSEVAVEKKSSLVFHLFFENEKFPNTSFDFNWDSLWFYLAKLGREIRFGSLEIMKYEKLALR